jgi:NitT/TauT family transport system permease protein
MPALSRHVSRWLPLSGPVFLILIWHIAVTSKWVSAILLPPPADTLSYMFQHLANGGLLIDLVATLMRTLQAFVVAALLGVPLGVFLGSAAPLYRACEFLIDFFRSTPASALIPLFMLIFGISDMNKVAIASFAAFLVILFTSAYGVMQARKTRLMAAKVMGAGRYRIFRDVLLLESLPQIMVGLRSGISSALVIVIVAEMFIGSETGLGHRIIDAQQVLNIKNMYASILLTGIFGYGLNMLFLGLEKKFIHWSGRA